MHQGIIAAILNSVSLILFGQSIWIGLLQICRRQKLEPPTAPPIDETSINPRIVHNTLNETQLSISRAVHPHNAVSSCPPTSSSKLRLTTACSSSSTLLGQFNNKSLYNHTVPYLSTYLFTIQALLGLAVSLTTVIWHINGFDTCHVLGNMSLIAFYIGFALLFMVSAIQTHLANDKCIKIFFIIGLGIATHFTMLAMALTNNIVQYPMERGEICLVEISQPLLGWLGNLPTYSAIIYFFMSFFSFVSFINGSFRLCTRSKFLSIRELSFVMAVYRGIGLLFVFGLLGALFNALGIMFSALKLFRFRLVWFAQWAVLSRVMAAALWHRASSDPLGHLHLFWSSDVYLAWHPVAEQHPSANRPSKMRVIHAVFCIIFRGNSRFANLSSSEEAPVDTTAKPNGNTGARMQTRARARTAVIGRDCVDNGIGHTDMHDRSSRHETVVADIVHCSSCTCGVFFE